eukprot:CAMPEP_0198136684 /NCGR_PEP_ID=MMETSP1443-20131203/308_1 /TAXON_ID=186043 /ORGANISM="Entomoneis sp., Strain CCMP2396" /LENGTH=240 /DNA_ID=CAMNT_0043797943 /DNA_START=154 /DNA_END=876 /DNA_ORIENTATION=-
MSEQPPKKKIKLTYFDIEGAAEPVRLALALAGVDYTDDRLTFADWPTLKPGTPYGQVPVVTGLFDDDDNGNKPAMKGQSGAMLRYIGSKYSKTLNPIDNLYDVEEAMGVVGDIKNSWSPCLYMGMRPEKYGYAKDYGKTEQGKKLIQTMRENWIKEELPTYVKQLEALLELHEGKWLASSSTDEPTICDCDAVVFLRTFTKGHMDHVPVDTLEKYPKIVDYIKRFCALTPVKGRYTSGLY